jgi:hypothetical protein
MRNLVLSILSAISWIVISPAHAEILTFDALAFESGPQQSYASFIVGEYVFTALQPASTPFLVRAKDDPNNADPDGATIGMATVANGGFSFARVDGEAFDFTGFEATHLTNSLTSPGNGGTLNVYFDDVVGLTSSYDINPGFQSYAFEGLGVRSVRITSNNYFQVDNVAVFSGAVPEPASWAMMIGGLAITGAAMRRRTQPLQVG